MQDQISERILRVIHESREPLETKEIQERVEYFIKAVTRTKLFYRLNLLRGDGLVKGKFIGPGKGVWIWWAIGVFESKGVKK